MVRVAVLSCLVLVLVPQTAAAEWQFTPFVGLTFKGNTSIVSETVDGVIAPQKVHRHFGGAVSFLGGGIFGVETMLNWTPGFFEQDSAETVEGSRSVAWMGNVVITAPRRWTEYSLRPYASGGFGLLKPHVRYVRTRDTAALPDVDLNLAGYNVGGGAIGFLTPRTGLRFDFRYFSTIRPTSEEGGISLEDRVRLRYMTLSVGIVIRR